MSSIERLRKQTLRCHRSRVGAEAGGRSLQFRDGREGSVAVETGDERHVDAGPAVRAPASRQIFVEALAHRGRRLYGPAASDLTGLDSNVSVASETEHGGPRQPSKRNRAYEEKRGEQDLDDDA